MEWKFDLDIGEDSKQLTYEEGVEILINKVTLILESVFSDNYNKTRITKFSNRINFSCPYCGDTHQNRFKFRGNVFFDNWKFKCFNCGILKNINIFLQDFKNVANIAQSDIWKIASLKSSNVNSYRNSSFFDIEEYKDFFVINYDEWVLKMCLEEIERGSEIYSYLRKRKIPKQYIQNIKYDPIKDALVIPNLITYNDTNFLIAYSDRPFVDRGSKYVIHNFKSLVDYKDEWDELEYENFNYIGNMYRFFNLNFSKKIIICEGYFDSLFLPNACSISGANKMIPFDGEFYFLFDNDKTGMNISIKFLKEGNGNVFKWKEFLSDYSLPDNLKDINDSVIELYKNGIDYRTIDFFKYFTNNKLDLLWL